MEDILEIFNEVWEVELYRGAILATGVFLTLLIFYWILKLILFCKFGRRRCSVVTVKRDHGDIVISADAVSAAIRAELKSFSELDIRRIVLYCKRGVYSMEIRCALAKAAGKRGLPVLHSLIEPLVKLRMEEIFGLTEINKITLKVERSDNYDDFTGDDVQVSPELPEVSMK